MPIFLGNVFKSGKWRPKEFFTGNKKTCMLSHIRVGRSDILSQVFNFHCEVSLDEQATFLGNCKNLFIDTMLNRIGSQSNFKYYNDCFNLKGIEAKLQVIIFNLSIEYLIIRY